ncbi:MAG: cation-transporting P-type ATPase [Nocardioides sp.]|nr:cation-transporting P-type ATPase [Nocardioides sp.]
MALSTAPAGLAAAEVEARRARHGRNVLPTPKAPKAWRRLARQLTHLLAILLWVAAALALLAGTPALAVAIVVIVVLNAVFAFWQESRADRSTHELRQLLPTETRVIRDGVPQSVEVEDLVVDDIVLLVAGDRVGADMEVVLAEGLGLDESMTTGETGAVRHEIGDLLLAGTFVVEGEATARVRATGASTTLAEISALTATAERPTSPLTRQLDHVVRLVAVIASATGVLLGGTSLWLGLGATEAFLFGVGVAVALVPEGLLPTVTLSLARCAQVMAGRNALVRHLDAVETLGSTTFICTDKTGTLTQNRMSVVEVSTPAGLVLVSGSGYEPRAEVTGEPAAVQAAVRVAHAAATCITGRVVDRDGWQAEGDPMEAALDCLTLRISPRPVAARTTEGVRRPFTPDRMLSSCLVDQTAYVLGAPEHVLARCVGRPPAIAPELARLTSAGRRVLAVAYRHWPGPARPEMETGLEILGLLALEDPPRPDVIESVAACRRAGIGLAMITGDHPETARTIAVEVGLFLPGGAVLDGASLPSDDAHLARLLDRPEGAVVARATPAAKLRIARALQGHGHVVAMTGDGVNDAPALRAADVGVAMGASGSDVAREAADLVLLDDHFATIVGAVELGRATFENIRRFLTFHLTDNVAELAPFALWALTAGHFPLAIGVLQVLALDIGSDMLPALALGTEPPRRGIMRGRRRQVVVDRALALRAIAVLGATEATTSLMAFTVVLLHGGWRWGDPVAGDLLLTASGTAFATIALCQVVNSFACRSTTTPVWRLRLRENPLVLAAVAAELTLLGLFLGVPALSDLLGGGWPSALGWSLAASGAALLVVVDGLHKTRAQRGQGG